MFFLLSCGRRAVLSHTLDLGLWWGRCLQMVLVMDVQGSGMSRVPRAWGLLRLRLQFRVCLRETHVSKKPRAPCQRWWWLLLLALALVTAQSSTTWVLLV